MSKQNVKLEALNFPPPQPVMIKLEVLEDLQLGTVFYTQGDVVQVLPHEARKLLTEYENYFEVVQE